MKGASTVKWIGIGTALQVAMVVVGHAVPAVASLFGPLGVAISLLVGLLWAREAAAGYRSGAVVGGACALVGREADELRPTALA